MKGYDHKKIEKKWQKTWDKNGQNSVETEAPKKKFYPLVEFPYPSGDGLHVGHIRSYTAMDVVARKKRGEGYDVMYPMGWDAFGLPTENYAIKTGIHPKEVTKKNTDNFRKQLKSIGFSFDWSREINTSNPTYYKWTQWIFTQLYKKGLAYKKRMPINWCLDCKIGLADEESVNMACERCGGNVEKREKDQWMLAITKYAERLDADLDDVDYLDRIKIQQRNWIGRSEGVQVNFELISQVNIGREQKISDVGVFTTRADTLFGVTYIVLSPEHKLLKKLLNNDLVKIDNKNEIVRYMVQSGKKADIDRLAEGREKTGIKIKGVLAINPANKERIPVFVADYVLAHYGTGAIMAVPAHDKRDFEFAKKFDLPIQRVIYSKEEDVPYVGEGNLIRSGEFDGINSKEARVGITKYVDGEVKTTHKLRDWIFSRQRYWGEPIPMIKCKKCEWVPVPTRDLPVKLPDIENYKPSNSGESPLAKVEEWVNTECPTCKGAAERETDVMPNWAGSSWYFLRYIDPNNQKEFASKNALKNWIPVDWYNGGMEHTTLHLLYSRFWHKFLFDMGVVPTHEPYQKRTSHGVVLAKDGQKMSKSKGNVINPDEMVKRFGADTLRLYEMFMGPFDQMIPWNIDNMVGIRRFLEKAWRIFGKVDEKNSDNTGIISLLNSTIKKVSGDIEMMKFNTAVSALMILLNKMEKQPHISKNLYATFLKLLSPFAPHISEELWEMLGHRKSIHKWAWPEFDPYKIEHLEVTIVVQINGKVRGRFTAKPGISKDEAQKKAFALPRVRESLNDSKLARIVYVKDRLINIVS